jgi:GntR family transcriptional regulator
MDITSLDKNSSEQLYIQIRRLVLKAIRLQELLPGQRIPSVNELSHDANVSRMTIRQALQALINEGYLYTVPGKGTFVAERPYVEQDLQHLLGWSEEIRAQGMRPSTHLISVESLPADRLIAHHLGLLPGATVYRIVRVRAADEFPLAVERAHLSCERFPGLDRLIQSASSLYSVLRQAYGVFPVRALQFIEAGQADQQAAELLSLAHTAPVLVLERISFSAANDPLEYVTSMTRSGFVRYRTELSVGGNTVRQVLLPPVISGAYS